MKIIQMTVIKMVHRGKEVIVVHGLADNGDVYFRDAEDHEWVLA